MTIITFGNFMEYSEEQYNEDKKRFYESKLYFLGSLIYGFSEYKLKKEEISKMDDIIKKKLSGNCENIYIGLSSFLIDFGIFYDLLSKEIKQELLNLDYTYENCKIMAKKMFNEFIEDAKKILPYETYICLNDKYFIVFCEVCRNTKITKSNFIKLIRDYFILDKAKNVYSTCRDPQLFGQIRMKMMDIYPLLKDRYGISRKLDLLLRFVDDDNDYNYKILKYILDKYYENKNKINNKYKPIKHNDDH